MNLSDILGIVASDLDQVEHELDGNIKSPVPLVYDISKYLLGSGGKRLRPSVLLLSSGACGLKNGKKRISSAAAFELIHTASLLHDDVVDGASLRRGRDSSNVVWGNKASVLVGDFMLARALGLIQSCGNSELIKVVTDAAAKLAEGQVLEVMSKKTMVETSEEICFGIIENKTASLIEGCGRGGAVLAGANDGDKEAIGKYALNLGIAFQLTDDALDYSSTEQEMGKEVGHDILEGKITLPLVYAITKATSPEKFKVSEILQNGSAGDRDLEVILEIVDRYDGVEKTKSAARDFVHRGKRAIVDFPKSEYKKSLDLLADYVVERRM